MVSGRAGADAAVGLCGCSVVVRGCMCVSRNDACNIKHDMLVLRAEVSCFGVPYPVCDLVACDAYGCAAV